MVFDEVDTISYALDDAVNKVSNHQGDTQTVDTLFSYLNKETLTKDEYDAILNLDYYPDEARCRGGIAKVEQNLLNDLDVLKRRTADPRIPEIEMKIKNMFAAKCKELPEEADEETEDEDLRKLDEEKSRIEEAEQKRQSERIRQRAKKKNEVQQSSPKENEPRKSTRERKKTEKVKALETSKKATKRSSPRAVTGSLPPKKRAKIDRRRSITKKPPPPPPPPPPKKKPRPPPPPPPKKPRPPPPPLPPKNNQPAPPAEGKKKKKAMKNGKTKRCVTSRPNSIASVKDQAVRLKFEVCAKFIKGLQNLNTFPEKEIRDFWPKSQHLMLTYDELVQKPRGKTVKRPTPLTFLLRPEGLDVKEFGKMLKRIGTAMEKGGRNIGKGYQIADTPEEYSDWVFGQHEKRKKG